jgi:hypothetical protein
MSQRATELTMRETFLRLALTATILFPSLAQPSLLRADDDQYEELSFHSPVPLGLDAVRVAELKRTVYLLASAENQSLDGLHISRQPHFARAVRSDGTDVKTYPGAMDFRVTASAIPNDFTGVLEYEINSKQSMNDFLLGLKFRLKIFRGIKMTEISPTNVKLIGVPSYQPYDERIYRLSFDTPNVPVDARLVLEVYDSSGTRLTRFHLEIL